MQPKKYIKIAESILSVISFSKECTSSSENELDEKLKKATNAVIERLENLDVVPQKLHISQRGLIYKLSTNKVATIVDFIFNYYNLTSKTYEEKNEIRKKIQQEHQIRKLKSGQPITLHKKFVKKSIPSVAPLFSPKITIKAETIDELTEKIRDSIWGLMEINTKEFECITGYEIKNLQARKLENYYEAEFFYKLFIEKTFENTQNQKYQEEK